MTVINSIVVFFGMISIARAALNCTIPITATKGCAQCFTYSIDDIPTGQYANVTCPPTVEQCRNALIGVYGENIVKSLDDNTVLQLCPILETTKEVPITEKRCIVNSTVVYSDCIADNDTIFVVKTPNLTDTGPTPIACFWNTPDLEANAQIYVDTLMMDIQGNPSSSCDDKLIIESDAVSEDRVACGTADQPVFYNELVNNRLDPFFLTNNTASRTGAELLFVHCKLPTRKRSAAVLDHVNGVATVDLCAPPKMDNTVHPVCTCKTLPVNITTLCSSTSLNNNPYYQKYLAVLADIPLNAAYGFRGYKGCLGAEFFRCDGFVESLTNDECRTFTLGMTPAEADQFLTDGASLWNLVSQAAKDTVVCNSVSSTVPNAQEHIQLQDLVIHPTTAKANACCTATNGILKKVAKYLKNASVPHFFG